MGDTGYTNTYNITNIDGEITYQGDTFEGDVNFNGDILIDGVSLDDYIAAHSGGGGGGGELLGFALAVASGSSAGLTVLDFTGAVSSFGEQEVTVNGAGKLVIPEGPVGVIDLWDITVDVLLTPTGGTPPYQVITAGLRHTHIPVGAPQEYIGSGFLHAANAGAQTLLVQLIDAVGSQPFTYSVTAICRLTDRISFG